MRYTGKLINYKAERGFGYVQHPSFDGLVFIHISQSECKTLKDGDELEFEVTIDMGRPQARKISNLSQNIGTKLKINLPISNSRPGSITQQKESPPALNLTAETEKGFETNNITPIRKNEAKAPRTDRALHLYMPWNPGYIHDQMFQLRDHLDQHGYTWIPKINSTKDKVPFDMKIVDVLDNQIKHGIETCLYMTNFHCIHIWKISEIYRSPKLSDQESAKTVQRYSEFETEFWFKVSDVYVLQADHDGKLTPILFELEKLSLCREDFENLPYNSRDKITPYMSAQRYPAPVTRIDNTIFFAGVAMLSINGESQDEVRREKWLNTHRKVTKEYNLMNDHLAKNLYPDIWETFNKRTQHFLIEMEMLKIESAGYNSLQSMQFAKQKFECYISAIINEFDDIVGHRLLNVCERHNVTRIALKDGNTNSLSILKGINSTVPDLNFYRSILTDPTWKEKMNDLFRNLKGDSMKIIGDILSLTEYEPIISKLDSLTKFRNWFAHDYFHIISSSLKGSKKEEELKLLSHINTILNLISSPYSNNNIFMDMYVYKTKQKHLVQTANLKNLVDELRPTSRKVAA